MSRNRYQVAIAGLVVVVIVLSVLVVILTTRLSDFSVSTGSTSVCQGSPFETCTMTTALFTTQYVYEYEGGTETISSTTTVYLTVTQTVTFQP